MPVVLHAVPFIFISLLSCCCAEEVICPAEVCTCKPEHKDGIPQLLSNCTQAFLHGVPQGLDSSTTALDMSDNNITQLRNDTFERAGILHVDRVFLSRNYIVGMESGTFRKLSSLSELHLESNLITSVLPGTFWGNPELIVLNLRNNRLSSLPVDIVTFKNHVQELDIGDNSIQKVDTYLVQRYYPELRRLDVSRNKISHIFSTSPLDNSSLEVVDASYNYIAELESNAFASASNLKELNASNNKISSLGNDVFARNPELVRVDVSNNHILTIHRDAFRKNPKIREIYAGSNVMTYLHPDTFRENPQLTKVTLSWNKIEDIDPQTFYDNPELEFLDFNNNKLRTLKPEVFQNNPNLRSVDLSSNSLVSIYDTTFHNNPNLQYLYLSENKHVRIHNGLLIVASSLKVFDAQHCNLSDLSPDFFKNTTNLRKLLLGNNNFTSLDCVSNTDTDDYMGTLTELQVLDLSNNQLQTIDIEIFKNQMSQLKSLRIEGNPFLCDCKLRNAWLWSQEVGIIPPQPQITCTSMQQRPVPWTDVKNLDCNDESHTEEWVSTGTYTKELTSTVTNKHTEKSTSTATSTHTDFSTQPQHADHSESEGIPNRAVPQVEEIHISTHGRRTRDIIIMIGVLISSFLIVFLVVLLMLFYTRRRSGMYKVSCAGIKTPNKRADFGAPAEGPPAL